MLVFSSTYSQYPQVKKIGNDSVVLITLKQGNDINKQFIVLNDSIKGLNKSLEVSKFDFNKYKIESKDNYNQLNVVSLKYKAEADSFRKMYDTNKRMYEFREYDFRRERLGQQVFTLVIMFVAVFFAAK